VLKSFQHEVRTVGFVELHKLMIRVVEFNAVGKSLLAEFAFEFGQ
jgi:hypothetical protein